MALHDVNSETRISIGPPCRIAQAVSARVEPHLPGFTPEQSQMLLDLRGTNMSHEQLNRILELRTVLACGIRRLQDFQGHITQPEELRHALKMIETDLSNVVSLWR